MPGIAHHGRRAGVLGVIARAESPSCVMVSAIPACSSHVVGLVYNYRNSLSENLTGDAKNVL